MTPQAAMLANNPPLYECDLFSDRVVRIFASQAVSFVRAAVAGLHAALSASG
jgi:hypothetical protein